MLERASQDSSPAKDAEAATPAGARWQLNKRIGPSGRGCGSVESTYLFMGGSQHAALINSCHIGVGPRVARSSDFSRKNQISDLIVKFLTLRCWPSLKQTNKTTLK